MHLFTGQEGGGIITAVRQWAPLLISAGWEIEFVLLQEGKAADMLRDARLDAHIIEAGKVGRYLSLGHRIAPLHPSILHVHNPASHLIAQRWAEALNARIVRTVHADMFEEMRTTQASWRIALWSYLMRRAFARVDALTIVSPHLRPLLPGVEVSGRAVTYIPNGFDAATITNDHRALPDDLPQWLGDRPMVLAMGRLVAVKNYSMLLHAWQQVVAQQPDARLVLAGSGPQRDALTNQVESLNLADSVRLLPWVDAIAPLLKRAQAVAISSVSECCPMLVFEAMSASVPVVATRVGGIPWIIEDEVSGLLVPSDNAAAMCGAILKSIDEDGTARMIGSVGHARLKSEFAPAKVAQSFAQVYSDLSEEG